MFYNFLLFAVTASVLAGNVTAVSPSLQNTPGTAEGVKNPNNINKTIDPPNINPNNSASNVSLDKHIVTDSDKTAHNDSNTVTNNTVKDTGKAVNNTDDGNVKDKTATKSDVDNKDVNATDLSAGEIAVDHFNKSVDSKTDNIITTVNQTISTPQKPLNNTNFTKKGSEDKNAKLDDTSKATNKNNSIDQKLTLPPTPITKLNGSDTNFTKKGSEDKNAKLDDTSKTTNKNNSIDQKPTLPPTPITKLNGSDTTVHGNGSIIHAINATRKANITATNRAPATISSGVNKWEAVLITALVVIGGCCGVILVRKSLRSERGRAWLERTRRQAYIPGRDYEVEYLVIRDSDD